jgi:hypothetical protein
MRKGMSSLAVFTVWLPAGYGTASMPFAPPGYRAPAPIAARLAGSADSQAVQGAAGLPADAKAA